MTAVPITNYLEDEYLVGPPGYLGGTFGEVTGMQAELKIAGNNEATGMQVEAKIVDEDDDKLVGMQVDRQIITQSLFGMQVEAKIIDVEDDKYIGFQVDFALEDIEKKTGFQTNFGKLQHLVHPKYLYDDEVYMEDSYLAAKRCALQGMQVEAQIVSEADDRFEGMQAQFRVDTSSIEGMQTQFRIDDQEDIGFQVNMVRTILTGMEVNFLIYNTTQLRILCDFASRGVDDEYNSTPGGDDANWQTDQAMAADDLGKLGNLNTDVLEQRIQTDGVTAFWQLRCDTGVGNTFIDTLFLGEHNFTKSATIQVQLSDSPTFASIKTSFQVDVNNGFDDNNAYYIAEDPPTIPGRYVRLLISDPANPDGYLRLGVVAFGSAQIFTPRECFDNPASFGFQHFKDTVETEGFSNNSNDRATRKKLGLNFTNLRLQGGNFSLLRDYFATAKTDLKCLIIPYPQRAAALAVFSKLVSLPEESHNASVIDDEDPTKDEWRVSLALDWDESL